MSFLAQPRVSLWRVVGVFLLAIGMIVGFAGFASSTAHAADDPLPTEVVTQPDADGDGVPDQFDNCPNSLPGEEVNGGGCPPQGEMVDPVAIDRPGVDNDAILTADIAGVRFFLRDDTILTPGEYPYHGGDTVIVNAHNPEGGFLFGCDCSAEWNLVFTNVGGETPPVELIGVTPVAPTIVDLPGVEDDSLFVPTEEGVFYTDAEGNVLSPGTHPVTTGGPFSVTANAEEGYVLTGLAHYTWPFQFSNEQEVPVVVPDPPVVAPEPPVVAPEPPVVAPEPPVNKPAPVVEQAPTEAPAVTVTPVPTEVAVPVDTQKVAPGQRGGSMLQSASGVNASSDSPRYGGLLGLPFVAAGIFILVIRRPRRVTNK